MALPCKPAAGPLLHQPFRMALPHELQTLAVQRLQASPDVDRVRSLTLIQRVCRICVLPCGLVTPSDLHTCGELLLSMSLVARGWALTGNKGMCLWNWAGLDIPGTQHGASTKACPHDGAALRLDRPVCLVSQHRRRIKLGSR